MGQKKKPRLTNLHRTGKFQNKLLKLFSPYLCNIDSLSYIILENDLLTMMKLTVKGMF